MLTVILTVGLPASGKSFFAKNLIEKNPGKYKQINKDELRLMLDNSKYSKDNEKFILKVRDQLILMSLENGKNVIISDTNLGGSHIEHITQLVKGKAKVVIEDFTDVPLEVCIERDLKRLNSVGEKAIRKMYNQFLKPKITPYCASDLAPSAVICDLDGTIALLNGRNPYDASNCQNDLLNEAVYSIIKYKYVIFVSGREDKYKPQTEEFLHKYGLTNYLLYMRKSGDMRKDSVIKEEIFNEYIRGKFNIEYVVDDRLSVCRLWHSLGLNLFRVGDPDSNF